MRAPCRATSAPEFRSAATQHRPSATARRSSSAARASAATSGSSARADAGVARTPRGARCRGRARARLKAVPLRRNRDFILLWSGQVVSTLGSEVSGLAFPRLVLSLTGSPAQAGIVGFARGLPYLLVYLPAGALVDRW